MTDELCQIAYNEGWLAYTEDFICSNNPYDGVNATLQDMWDCGWWDAFYEVE